MPLSCDCYDGCWGDHSKKWPYIGLTSDVLSSLYLWCQANIPYGSYVKVAATIRFETEELKNKAFEARHLWNSKAMTGAAWVTAEEMARQLYWAKICVANPEDSVERGLARALLALRARVKAGEVLAAGIRAWPDNPDYQRKLLAAYDAAKGEGTT